MDLWTALRVYAARWYVAVPVLLMSFYAAYVIGQTINPTYETAGSILLVPPLEPVPVEIRTEYEPIVNPCLRPGNGPRSCADAVARILLSEGEMRRFEAIGLSPDYEITIPRDSLIIDYTVAGDSESQVTETLDELVRRTNTELLGIQQTTNTPANQIISVEALYLAEEPEEFSGGRLRVVAALAMVGVIASASIAFLVDNLASRRGSSVHRAIHTEPTAKVAPAEIAPAPTQPPSRQRIEVVTDDEQDDDLLEPEAQTPTDAAKLSDDDKPQDGSNRRRIRRRHGQSIDEAENDSTTDTPTDSAPRTDSAAKPPTAPRTDSAAKPPTAPTTDSTATPPTTPRTEPPRTPHTTTPPSPTR
ncbi:MAG: hypothetical protein GY713_06940, partial [Actinomycetia bacterium]|nr:hypothetical protein [Actinomycetes bacterium]